MEKSADWIANRAASSLFCVGNANECGCIADTHTATEVIAAIEQRGEEVINALRKLKALGELTQG